MCDIRRATKEHPKLIDEDLKISKIGQHVLMDMWGPITLIEKGNFRYMANIIDATSRFMICVPTKDKSYGLEAFKVMEPF